MAYSIKDWEDIDKFLTIVRTIDRFEKCETVYDLFGIKDKNASYSEVELIIDSFVKIYAGSNAPKYKDIGKKIPGEAERIKSVLKDYRKEYNDYLKKNDPRIKRLKQNFDFCTKKDKVLDSKEKANLIEHGIEDGLEESEIITCINEWLIDAGVKDGSGGFNNSHDNSPSYSKSNPYNSHDKSSSYTKANPILSILFDKSNIIPFILVLFFVVFVNSIHSCSNSKKDVISVETPTAQVAPSPSKVPPVANALDTIAVEIPSAQVAEPPVANTLATLAAAVPLSDEEKAKLLAKFVLIHGGVFTMGSPEGEAGRELSETQHQVRLSDFSISKYAVTATEFKRFVDATGYQWVYGFQGNENLPVVNVSWNDAVAYCTWLSAETGRIFRLPTEAEWEYACRAGSTTAFNTGENLTTNQANYNGNFTVVAVNTFAPNAWGLYNMHGNVSEFCNDVYSYDYYRECKVKGLVENPAGPAPDMGSTSSRIRRGGSCYAKAVDCRSASRDLYPPYYRGGNGVGFRLVLVP